MHAIWVQCSTKDFFLWSSSGWFFTGCDQWCSCVCMCVFNYVCVKRPLDTMNDVPSYCSYGLSDRQQMFMCLVCNLLKFITTSSIYDYFHPVSPHAHKIKVQGSLLKVTWSNKFFLVQLFSASLVPQGAPGFFLESAWVAVYSGHSLKPMQAFLSISSSRQAFSGPLILSDPAVCDLFSTPPPLIPAAYWSVPFVLHDFPGSL